MAVTDTNETIHLTTVYDNPASFGASITIDTEDFCDYIPVALSKEMLSSITVISTYLPSSSLNDCNFPRRFFKTDEDFEVSKEQKWCVSIRYLKNGVWHISAPNIRIALMRLEEMIG